MELGRRLKELRKAKGLTQTRLAELLGVHLQTVSKWERGVNEPDISLLGEIASVLGASVRRQVLLVKLLPHKLVMKVWMKQQGHANRPRED